MTEPARKPHSKTIKSRESNPNRYEKDYSWSSKDIKSAKDIRTTTEMVAFLDSPAGKDVEVDARVIAHHKEKGFRFTKLDKTKFIESFKSNGDGRKKFKEAFDAFASGGFSGGGIGPGSSNTVGQDFTPLLGGPFYKQLYYYNDWLRMHQDCFFAMNHDPIGKATVNIITDFVLGKGFHVELSNPVHQAIWDAFEEANDFQEMMRTFCRELSGYGEDMIWKLPGHQRFIGFGKETLDKMPKAFLPRVRLVDPSNIVEIVTYPEDITRKLFYVWLTPTQYQIYTGKDQKTGQVVNSTKLIYQQIPADQILHYKVNAVSNEKRGRSDLFAALPYFKRLRDSVNYSMIADQKNAAWAIDTEIQGDQQDVDAYISAQEDLGTIPAAGSEFVHTAAIKRQYLANQGASSRGASNSFEWCLSMIAACTRIPISYYGTHMSGGQTRGSAIISTEPVAKMFEMRQNIVKSTIEDIVRYVMEYFNLSDPEFEIHMPEIITQDRTAKLKDIYLAEQAEWISAERAAETAASEFGFKDYDFQTEQEKIKATKALEPALMLPASNPLTDPPKAGGVGAEAPAGQSAVTGDDKKQVKKNDSK